MSAGLACPEPVAARAAAGPRLTPALVALCRGELLSRLPGLLAAIRGGDVARLRLEAHTMRGVAANFGLLALTGRLAEIEDMARQADLPALHGAAVALPAELEAALAALAAEPA